MCVRVVSELRMRLVCASQPVRLVAPCELSTGAKTSSTKKSAPYLDGFPTPSNWALLNLSTCMCMYLTPPSVKGGQYFVTVVCLSVWTLRQPAPHPVWKAARNMGLVVFLLRLLRPVRRWRQRSNTSPCTMAFTSNLAEPSDTGQNLFHSGHNRRQLDKVNPLTTAWVSRVMC